MKRRGIVMVRAQYSRNKKTGRRNKRTKTPTDLAGLIKYLNDEDHPNHDGIRTFAGTPWRDTVDSFVSEVVAAAAAYRKISKGKAGAPWNEDIAEHLIAAPDERSDLNFEEVKQMAIRILEQVSPRSPAAWSAHFDPETKTWEIHFAISSFTEGVSPELRVTDLRRRESADYGQIIDDAGAIALNEINVARFSKGLPQIRSLADLHSQKIESVTRGLADLMGGGATREPSVQELLELFAGSAWTVQKSTKTAVSLLSQEFKTPLHIRWADLLHHFARQMATQRNRDPERMRDARSNSNVTDIKMEQTREDYGPNL